jgi:hypothetical protein
MRKLPLAIVTLLFIISCQHQKNLSEQLNDSFTNHLKKIDASATLDSVHIIWNTIITEKVGRIIDDSMYVREFMRIQAQLMSAQKKNDIDSIQFLQYEINIMKEEIDSVTKSIGKGDTTRKYGYLIGCAYHITKKEKKKIDTAIVFIDSTSTMRYTEFMDSSIRRTIKSLN